MVDKAEVAYAILLESLKRLLNEAHNKAKHIYQASKLYIGADIPMVPPIELLRKIDLEMTSRYNRTSNQIIGK